MRMIFSSLAIILSMNSLSLIGQGQTVREQPKPSMMFACEANPFLSTSVSTPMRDRVPLVEIQLVDPHSREQGASVSGTRIPNSQYADVVQVPKAPMKSRERAVEVCAAEPGTYELRVFEHGDALYRVTVAVNHQSFIEGNLHAQEGRVRRYKFSFNVENEQVALTWLDKKGRPQLNIGQNDW